MNYFGKLSGFERSVYKQEDKIVSNQGAPYASKCFHDCTAQSMLSGAALDAIFNAYLKSRLIFRNNLLERHEGLRWKGVLKDGGLQVEHHLWISDETPRHQLVTSSVSSMNAGG